MFRALWFLIKAGVLVALAVWLAHGQGRVEIEWRGYLVETSPGFIAAVLAVFLIVWTLAYRLWRAIVAVPSEVRRTRALRRREEGYEAVTQGLVAIAAGDARLSDRYAKKAEQLVPGAPLTRLLTAQNALAQGNMPKARREFTNLLDDPQGAFFGLRGLLAEAMDARNHADALAYARRAYDMQPKRAWVVRTLFDLEARNRHWAKAHKMLTRAEKLQVFDADYARRHRQALLLAQAEEETIAGRDKDAADLAAAAFRKGPGFVPAAVTLARAQLALNKRAAAMKTVQKAWSQNPHPDLADLWRSLQPPVKKALSVYDAGRPGYEWMQQLCRLAPDHRDSLRALGVAALEARQWREARPLLERAMDYRALARLEQEESGDAQAVQRWLARAADEPQQPRWVCQECGHAALQWHALCRQCMAFDSQEWMVPQGLNLTAPLGLASQGSAAYRAQDILTPP